MSNSGPSMPSVPATVNWDPVRQKLLGDDLGEALQAVQELRQNIEITRSSEFHLMLSALLPAFSSILFDKTKSTPDVETVDHKLRNEILNLISEFPRNEVLRPHAPHLVALAMDILNKDYEENALVASKIILDCYKIYRPLPQDYVQPYLDFVLSSYRSLPATVARNFAHVVQLHSETEVLSANASKQSQNDPEDATMEDTEEGPQPMEVVEEPNENPPKTSSRHRLNLRASASFKVLKECPLTVMLMFQLYPKFLRNNIGSLIKVMVEALGLRAPRLESILPTTKTPSVAVKRLYASQMRELVAAQVKTLSFLTYLLRTFANEFKPYEERLANCVVALLSSCPRESVGTRKELLVATRLLLNTDFRRGFFRHIDTLLDERVLLGSQHRFSDESPLRTLGYLTLSELIQHARTLLPMKQMARVATMFCRMVHDTSNLPASMKFTAVRTLLSLVETIAKNKDPDPQLGRDILVRMLLSLVEKLEAIQVEFPKVLERERNQLKEGVIVVPNPSEINIDGTPVDTVRDLQGIIRIIIVGNKSIIQSIYSYRSTIDKEKIRELMVPPAGSNEEVASAAHKMTNTEVALVNRYIEVGLDSVKLLKESASSNADGVRIPGEKSLTEHHRDSLTYFAASFMSFDGYTLRRTLGVELQVLLDAVVADSSVMQIPRHLLAQNPQTSFEFCNILMDHLMDRLDSLDYQSTSDFIFLDEDSGVAVKKPASSAIDDAIFRHSVRPQESVEMKEAIAGVYLQLLERLLKSLMTYSGNEIVLRRHLRPLVTKCMQKLSENTDHWPDNYCMLLRHTFRAISQGKFQESYKELLPLLPTVLNGLYRIICSTNGSSGRGVILSNTAVELCLTIPARLSSLLPHLGLLLRIIVHALMSELGELVHLGLRTLEFWVDNLNPSFLYPELSQQKCLLRKLVQALSHHLQPAPYAYGLLTLRLLGKLGGRGREFLREPVSLEIFELVEENGPSLECSWKTSGASGANTTNESNMKVSLPLSVDRCAAILRTLALSMDHKIFVEDHEVPNVPAHNELWGCPLDSGQMELHIREVERQTLLTQAESCFRVLEYALRFLEDPNCIRGSLQHITRGLLCSSALPGSFFSRSTRLLLDNISIVGFDTLSVHLVEQLVEDADVLREAALELLEKIIQQDEIRTSLSSVVQSICNKLHVHVGMHPCGLVQGLSRIFDVMGLEWASQFASLSLKSALVALKGIPSEFALESMKMTQSFLDICSLVLGPPSVVPGNKVLYDSLVSDSNIDGAPSREVDDLKPLSRELFLFFTTELASQHSLTRFVSRFILTQYVPDSQDLSTDFYHENVGHLKTVLFSRSLKVLPLPQQAAVLEATAFVMKSRPNLFPISDQHILAFLSEFLKFASVADGALKDDSMKDYLVDRDGLVRNEGPLDNQVDPQHYSTTFNRRKCVLRTRLCRVVVPPDAPEGVKLRSAGVKLAHFTILRHSDEFFGAEGSSTLGNIRPHVVSLLFRSLVSASPVVVESSFAALSSVHSLSMESTTDENGANVTRSRLPRKLLQTCIHPVLYELRQFSSLSVPLLRGLARLLDLLSSWFNRTLGEKLLEHLQKWTNPNRIRELRLVDDVKETAIASSAVELFAMIPHGSTFVEPLVKICIKLESSLHVYKTRVVFSPYRKPLACYLNKYPEHCVSFFFPRLKTPLYSELFQSIVKMEESSDLRKYLLGGECSELILNKCFERPLGILRAENPGPDGGPRSPLAVHGIQIGSPQTEQTSQTQTMNTESMELQYQGFRLIETLLEADSSYFREHNSFVRAFRLLWRSRGRHVRLQHEDLVPPRYVEESKHLARFQLIFSHFFPSEEGVLFELVLVFLQSSICDFSFITHHLHQSLPVMSHENSKQLLDRFFSHVGGSRNEEPKMLRLRHLIVPILKQSTESIADLSSIIEEKTIHSFVEEVILKSSESFGDKFRAEILRLLILLVDKTPYLENSREDILQLCFTFLDGADDLSKSLSPILASYLISRYELRKSYVLKVLDFLIKSYQPEGKELLWIALDRLVPTLEAKLSPSELEQFVDQAFFLIEDESKSVVQIAHVCSIVSRYPNLFIRSSGKLRTPLLGCLSRLGLSVNSSTENRAVAVNIAKVLLEWASQVPDFPLECVNKVIKFLFRLKLILSDLPDSRTVRLDPVSVALESRVNVLIGTHLVKWRVDLDPEPFEKVCSKEKIDLALLYSCLELFTTILSAGVSDFFEKFSGVARKILTLSFLAMKEDKRMKSLLKGFSSSIKSQKELQLFWVPLEQVLIDSNLKLKVPSTPRQASPRDKQKAAADELSLLRTVDFALKLFDGFCAEPKLVLGQLESTLLPLLTTLCRMHISEKQRQGTLDPSRTSSGTIRFSSPTRGIIEETYNRVHSLRTNPPTTKQPKNDEKETLIIDCIVYILSVFEGTLVLSRFTRSRRGLLSSLVSLLESSDSPILLVMCVRFIGKELLLPEHQRPFTTKEFNAYIWKISSFDFSALSRDASLQAVSVVVGFFLCSLWNSSVENRERKVALSRCIVGLLLDPNLSRRSSFFQLMEELEPKGESLFVYTSKLWRTLHLDLDSLGNRYWTIVITETLLSSLDGADEALLDSIKNLIHGDRTFCQGVFRSLFSSAWGLLSSDSTRVQLGGAVESLISKPSNAQFIRKESIPRGRDEPSNAVSSLLNVVSVLKPVPLIDPHILYHTAAHYNCWYEAISLLENQVQLSFKAKMSQKALVNCYQRIEGEQMILHTLDEGSISSKGLKGFSFDIYGETERAVKAYGDLMSSYETETEEIKYHYSELDLWEERWAEMNRELCQLEVVDEFAKLSKSSILEIETASKYQDWARVKELCTSPALEASLESGHHIVKMHETQVSMMQKRTNDYHNPHAQCAQLCLYNWQLLPRLCQGSSPHAELLHTFHRLVEIRESGQVLEEVRSHPKGKNPPELRNLFQTWRDRLPGQMDPLRYWEDILSWRNGFFDSVVETLETDDSGLPLLHDRPWTMIRFAKAARNLDLGRVSLYLIDRVSAEEKISVENAFTKLREQIYSYKEGDESARHEGLNFINKTVLNYFDEPQKSEIFRLKGHFFASLGGRGRSKAHQAYSHAVQVCPNHAKAWSCWGSLCSTLGDAAEDQKEQSESEDPQRSSSAKTKKVAQYRAQALGCFLQALQLDTSEFHRLGLAKCLLILSKEDLAPGVLSPTFDSRCGLVPSWVWIPWIPQLLTSLYRAEGRVIRNLLTRIVRSYPQAVYYSLRAYYLDRRDVERVRTVASGSHPPLSHMPSVNYADDLMSTFRRSHVSLWTAIESILEEVVVNYRNSHEEEFLGTFIALQERAELQLFSGEDDASIALSIWKTIDRISKKFFKSGDELKTDERSIRANKFKEKYREKFEKDFEVKSNGEDMPDGPKSFPLEELIKNIRSWRSKLENEVSELAEASAKEASSPRLSTFAQGSAPDLWPGSCDPKYACPRIRKEEIIDFDQDSGLSLVSSSSSAEAAQKAANTAMANCITSLAYEGISGEYGGGSSSVEVPGQYAPQTSIWSDTRPCPELHHKIAKFHPHVRIIKRNEHIIRCVSVLSHDGKTHEFMIQAGLPYLTRSDERAAQVNYVIDKLLSQDKLARRQCLSIQSHPTIFVAQRLRLSQEPKHTISLQDIAENELDVDLDELGRKYNEALIDHFRKEKGKSGDNTLDVLNDSTRLKLFQDMFSAQISLESRRILLTYVHDRLGEKERLHQFRRAFARQCGINSLLQFAFSAVERTPSRFAFNLQDGRVIAREFRLNYNSQGLVENLGVPFRLTPSVSTAIGQPYLKSHFTVSIGASAGAIASAKDHFEPVLQIVLRDDLVGFSTKSMAKSDSKTVELEKQLSDRFGKNVDRIMNRLIECSPRTHLDDDSADPIDSRIRNLVSQAQDKANLATMSGSFHGWL